MKKKKVIILGAGFAGIRCCQDLSRSMGNEIDIVLIDKNDFNLFRADLYEVATAFTEKKNDQCLRILKDTVATPIKDLIDEGKVSFMKEYVEGIFGDYVVVGGEKVRFDYLVVALGSVTNCFGIEGLQEFSFPLKKLADGIKINCNLDFYLRRFARGELGKEFNLVVGGGGATGVEFSAELVRAVERLARKYDFDKKKVHVRLVEGGETLGGFDKDGSALVRKRLKELGVKVHMRHYIKKAMEDKVLLEKDGKEVVDLSDLTVWTGGVKVNPVVSSSVFANEKKRGAIEVGGDLRALGSQNVFAAGDNAYFACGAERLPMLADVAINQGRCIAKNIEALIRGRDLSDFKWNGAKYYLPIGGKWAITFDGKKYKTGFFVWIRRRFTFLKYALSILPFEKAVKKWWKAGEVFEGEG